jgi:hypothetical protein
VDFWSLLHPGADFVEELGGVVEFDLVGVVVRIAGIVDCKLELWRDEWVRIGDVTRIERENGLMRSERERPT